MIQSLKTLDLRYCRNITDQAKATLLAKNVNLKINGRDMDIPFIFKYAKCKVLETNHAQLLSTIADINAKDGNGKTLLDIAINRSPNNLLCEELMNVYKSLPSDLIVNLLIYKDFNQTRKLSKIN